MTGNGDHFQTPPLTVPASNGKPLTVESRQAVLSTQIQRPFSPLTLDELGLHPPSTPSALLDIITTPVSLALHEGSATAADIIDTSLAFTDKQQGRLIKDGDASYPRDGAHKQDSKAADGTSLLSSTSSGPTASNDDSFLTSFLRSLTEEKLASEPQPPMPTEMVGRTMPVEHDPPTIDSHQSRCKAPSQIAAPSLVGSINYLSLSKASAASAGSHSSSMPQVKSQSSAASHPLGEIPISDFHRLFQTTSNSTNSSCFAKLRPASPLQSSSDWRSSLQGQSYRSKTNTTSHTFQTSKKARSRTSAATHRSGGYLVTSTPLEQPLPSSTVGDNQKDAANLATSSREDMSTSHGSASNSLKAIWPLGNPGITHFSLPQALPLQPEHRYPISILGSDENYETDLETDRESENSPAGSHSFGYTPKAAKRKSLEPLQLGSQSDSNNNPQATSLSSQAQGKTASSELKGSSGRAENPLKIVPLSNVVWSKSWLNASSPASDRPGTPPWIVSCAETHSTEARGSTKRANDAAKSSSAPLSSFGSATNVAIPSTPSSTIRSASYDFTRQALLDLIRQTNLGMASNSTLRGTDGSTNIKTSDSFQAATSTQAATSSSCSAPSFSSTVPADLQARLQSWQLHRKRQRGLEEATNKASKSQDTSAASTSQTTVRRRSIPSSSTCLGETNLEDQFRTNKRNNTEEQEQEHKTRRQEHYQRLLFQLNSQMQMKMRMDMQKQKQKESQDKAQLEASSRRKSNSSKEVEFRKPCLPSKFSTAQNYMSEASTSFSQSTDNSVAPEYGSITELSSTQAAKQPVREEHNTRPSTAVPVANLSASKSNDGAARITALRADSCFHGVPDSLSSGLSTSSWAVGSDPTFRNGRPRSSLSSSATCQRPQPNDSISWQAVFAPQYDPSSNAYVPGWQSQQSSINQPLWQDSASAARDSALLSQTATTTTWTDGAGPSVFDSANSMLAMELMWKHPNWRRDTGPASVAPMSDPIPRSTSKYTPHYVDTSSFTISKAAASDSMPVGAAQAEEAGGSPPPISAGNSKVKRPVSPGAEVVFWAVKGDRSVKLTGTVDSVSILVLENVIAGVKSRFRYLPDCTCHR